MFFIYETFKKIIMQNKILNNFKIKYYLFYKKYYVLQKNIYISFKVLS